MVDFEGFIPVYNGEVTENVDRAGEKSSYPTLGDHAEAAFFAGADAPHAQAAAAGASHAGAARASALHAGVDDGVAVDAVASDRSSDGEYRVGAGAVRVASEERLSTRVCAVVPTNEDGGVVCHLRSLLPFGCSVGWVVACLRAG